MNRPTIDVEDLLDMADEAFEAGDFSQAVEILRKAATIAPLRKDIRSRLAIALEGTPIPRRNSTKQVIQQVYVPQHEETVFISDDLKVSEENRQGREAISQIARKAFDAAADHTAKAGIATRNLTNLLQQGIKTWKSSLSEIKQKGDFQSAASSPAVDNSDVSGVTRANVFKPEKDLRAYLERAAKEDAEHDQDDQCSTEETDSGLKSSERLTRNLATSTKTGRSSAASGKHTRPIDVEDILAAGIGGFIETVGEANKTKIAYGVVYLALTALFTFACYDVSRKFPGVSTIPGREVKTASIGVLDLNVAKAEHETISTARGLVADGSANEAITILRQELQLAKTLHSRDLLRIELAGVLNGVAEQQLRANQFNESVSNYREALNFLPSDPALKLRLGNALYYQGTLSNAATSEKNTALSDAAEILKDIIDRDGANLQAYRLYALVNEASGRVESAKTAWKRVKGLAASDSAEFKEAESHLK